MDRESHLGVLEKTSGNKVPYHCVDCGRTNRQTSRSFSWILLLIAHALIAFSVIAALLYVPGIGDKLSDLTSQCHNEAAYCTILCSLLILPLLVLPLIRESTGKLRCSLQDYHIRQRCLEGQPVHWPAFPKVRCCLEKLAKRYRPHDPISIVHWPRLMETNLVRGVWVSRDEASRAAISGLSAGNDTVAALLGVQHNLHCVVYT